MLIARAGARRLTRRTSGWDGDHTAPPRPIPALGRPVGISEGSRKQYGNDLTSSCPTLVHRAIQDTGKETTRSKGSGHVALELNDVPLPYCDSMSPSVTAENSRALQSATPCRVLSPAMFRGTDSRLGTRHPAHAGTESTRQPEVCHTPRGRLWDAGPPSLP